MPSLLEIYQTLPYPFRVAAASARGIKLRNQRYGKVFEQSLEEAIDRGDALVALVIPSDFANERGGAERVPLQLLVDGSDANTAAIAIGYAEAVVGSLSRDVLVQNIRRSGGRATNMTSWLHVPSGRSRPAI